MSQAFCSQDMEVPAQDYKKARASCRIMKTTFMWLSDLLFTRQPRTIKYGFIIFTGRVTFHAYTQVNPTKGSKAVDALCGSSETTREPWYCFKLIPKHISLFCSQGCRQATRVLQSQKIILWHLTIHLTWLMHQDYCRSNCSHLIVQDGHIQHPFSQKPMIKHISTLYSLHFCPQVDYSPQ